MELIYEFTPFNNPFDNILDNQINIISNNLSHNIFDSKSSNNKYTELNNLNQENIKKYNDFKNNIELLEEVIIELEKKSTQILESIKYIENINKDSIRLFTTITR